MEKKTVKGQKKLPTESNPGNGRRTRQEKGLLFWLAASSLTCLALAILLKGGAPLYAVSILLLCSALAVLPVVFAPPDILNRCGAVPIMVGALLLPLVHGFVSIIPLPPALVGILAPGLQPTAWRPLAAATDAVLTDLAFWILLATFACTVGIWACARRSRTRLEMLAVCLCLTIVTVTATHAIMGAQSVMGLVPTTASMRTMFLPFVNQNHLGALLVMLLPIVLATATRHETPSTLKSIAIMTGILGGLELCFLQSHSTLVVGAAVCAVTLIPQWVVRQKTAYGVLSIGGIVGYGLWTLTLPDFAQLSWRMRLHHNLDALSALPSHWFLGSGLGTYGQAIEPYRTDNTYVTWDHAHNEILEWVFETGLVGLGIASCMLIAFYTRLPYRDASRTRPIRIGLLGFAVCCLVEFPFQLPALAMLAVGLLTLRKTLYARRRTIQPGRMRLLAVTLVLCSLLGSAWTGRTWIVEREEGQIRAAYQQPQLAEESANRLRTFHPQSVELTLYDAWIHLKHQRTEEAISLIQQAINGHPTNSKILTLAAHTLWQAQEPEAAQATLDAALKASPSSYKPWLLKGHIALSQGEPLDAVTAWGQAFARQAPVTTLDVLYPKVPIALLWLSALDQADGRVLDRLSILCMREKHYEEAILIIEEGNWIDEKRFKHIPRRIRALYLLKRYDKALVAVQQARQIDPDKPELIELHAMLYEATKRYAQALELNLQLGMRPGARLRAVRMAHAVGGPEQALQLLGRMELEHGLTSNLSVERARMLYRADRKEECIIVLEKRNLNGHPTLGTQATILMNQCKQL